MASASNNCGAAKSMVLRSGRTTVSSCPAEHARQQNIVALQHPAATAVLWPHA